MMTSLGSQFSKILLSKNMNSKPPSETQSEISSADSDWSDIRSIAAKLGVDNPDDLLTERFKIDRQKLENMIKAESSIEGWNSAEYFFDNVMRNTSTYISWPCRLKIGAKTKKDPHVRIVGKPNDVAKAKERILASLDSRGTRVIMKMDVSYTDHSYIIGRSGNNIKRIMEITSTHIHFPDSNRCNPTEKSNQVSLCGSLEGVERARSLVRSSTPLLISFELPVMAPGQPVPDHDTPYIKEVEANYNVQVIFSTRPKLHSSLVLVKGSEKEASKVKEATQLLINFTCESIASQISVNMQLEISPQHHEVVKGKNGVNLLSIMDRTQTKIIFPDVHDMNIKPIKKSQVTISGTIDGVYNARQQLIGNLPIALIFDYPDSQSDTSGIVNLSNKYGVFITLRQKQRQSIMAVVIKGVEKFIDKVYEARHEILSLNTPLMKPEIPPTYYSPRDQELELSYKHTLTTLLSSHPESPLTPSMFQANQNKNDTNNNMAKNIKLNNNVTSQANYMSSNYNNMNSYQKFQGSPNGICQANPKVSPLNSNNYQSSNLNNTNNHNICTNNNNYLSVPNQNISPRNSSISNTSYSSFSSSTASLEQGYPLTGSMGSITGSSSQGHYSPDSTFNDASYNKVGRRLSDGGLQTLNEYRAHFDVKQQTPRVFDFDMKRVIGLKAMERAPQGEIRTPNSNWVGLGLSRTSPAPLETVDDMAAWNRNSLNSTTSGITNLSPYSLGATTGLVESSSNRRLQLSQHKDIHSLLTALGLEHYIKTFVMNEIDMEMFISLTEENLIELGITAFGARKKLLHAIYTLSTQYEALNRNCSPIFSGSAAPGAERRTSNGWEFQAI